MNLPGTASGERESVVKTCGGSAVSGKAAMTEGLAHSQSMKRDSSGATGRTA